MQLSKGRNYLQEEETLTMQSTKIPPTKYMDFPNLPEITITKNTHQVENINKKLRPSKNKISCQSASYSSNHVFKKSSNGLTKKCFNRSINNSCKQQNFSGKEMPIKDEAYSGVSNKEELNHKSNSGVVLHALL